MSISNFKIENFKTTYPYEKWLKKFNDGKGVSTTQKVSRVLQKIPIEKMRFQAQKYERYLKSKNDFKRPLEHFNKKLWPIWVFLLVSNLTWQPVRTSRLFYPFGVQRKPYTSERRRREFYEKQAEECFFHTESENYSIISTVFHQLKWAGEIDWGEGSGVGGRRGLG